MLIGYSLCMDISKNAAYLMKGKGGISFLREIEADLGKVPFFGSVPTGEETEWGEPDCEEVESPQSITLGGKVWHRIGGGADREVYRHGTLVLKFPSNYLEAEEDANDIEFDVYQQLIGKPIARFFAPSIAILSGYVGGRVLVARYISKSVEKARNELAGIYSLWDFLEERMPESVRIGDLHCENHIGKTVIDYGRFYINSYG